MGSWVARTAASICIMMVIALPALAKYQPPEVAGQQEQQVGTDPLLKTSWYLEHIGVFEAWKTTKGDPSVTVAIIDSGLKYNHPEFTNRIRYKKSEVIDKVDNDGNGFVDDLIGWNFNEEMRLPFDDNGHGTFVASIIAAEEGNGIGGVGICPKCTIMPLRFLDSDGLGDTADAVRSINYAAQEKVSVINLSFAGEGYDRDLHTALVNALKADVVVVAACGNDGENIDKEDIYPAKFDLPNLLSVAATRKDDDTSSRSNYGTKYVHLGAPGVNIWGLWEDLKWYRSSGTSFASPMVAGVAALIRSAHPELSAPQVVEIIKASVRKSEALQEKVSTGGIVDAGSAMNCANDSKLPCLSEKTKSYLAQVAQKIRDNNTTRFKQHN